MVGGPADLWPRRTAKRAETAGTRLLAPPSAVVSEAGRLLARRPASRERQRPRSARNNIHANIDDALNDARVRGGWVGLGRF